MRLKDNLDLLDQLDHLDLPVILDQMEKEVNLVDQHKVLQALLVNPVNLEMLDHLGYLVRMDLLEEMEFQVFLDHQDLLDLMDLKVLLVNLDLMENLEILDLKEITVSFFPSRKSF